MWLGGALQLFGIEREGDGGCGELGGSGYIQLGWVGKGELWVWVHSNVDWYRGSEGRVSVECVLVGVKELECGDRVIVLCWGVVMVVAWGVCGHELENDMVCDRGGGWRCPKICTGEKYGALGENTIEVVGECGVVVDVVLGVMGDGGMPGDICIIESVTMATAAHRVPPGVLGEVECFWGGGMAALAGGSAG